MTPMSWTGTTYLVELKRVKYLSRRWCRWLVQGEKYPLAPLWMPYLKATCCCCSIHAIPGSKRGTSELYGYHMAAWYDCTVSDGEICNKQTCGTALSLARKCPKHVKHVRLYQHYDRFGSFGASRSCEQTKCDTCCRAFKTRPLTVKEYRVFCSYQIKCYQSAEPHNQIMCGESLRHKISRDPLKRRTFNPGRKIRPMR